MNSDIENTNLEILAEAATYVAVAGDQMPVEIRLDGHTFQPPADRKVHVVQGNRGQPPTEWTGPLRLWHDAVKKAASKL